MKPFAPVMKMHFALKVLGARFSPSYVQYLAGAEV